MHHAVGIGLLIVLIGFAFGERTAKVCVGIGLIAGAMACVYVAVLIITGSI